MTIAAKCILLAHPPVARARAVAALLAYTLHTMRASAQGWAAPCFKSREEANRPKCVAVASCAVALPLSSLVLNGFITAQKCVQATWHKSTAAHTRVDEHRVLTSTHQCT